MKSIPLALFVLAGSSALLILHVELASACPDDLVCGNFTEQDKADDCEYITSQNLDDEQDLLCILWDQSYDYDSWHPDEYELDIDLSMEANEIDNSSIILASKIIVFGLLNYFAFSLTKLSFLAKWLSI